MPKIFKFILGLISADIVIIAIVFLLGLTGVIDSGNKKNTSVKVAKNDTYETESSTTNKHSDKIPETKDSAAATTDTAPSSSTEQLTTDNDETTTKEISADNQFIVLKTTSKVYLREMPSTNGKIIKELSSNTYGDVISSSGGWTKVNYNGTTGYVYSEYLATGDSASDLIKQLNFSKITINSSCNMRHTPDTNAEVFGNAIAGTTYQYDASKSDENWYAIILPDSSIAYISTGYASVTN